MPLHTSFVLRCWLPRNYSIENIQTGSRFHSTDLAEIMRWIEATSAAILEHPPTPEPEEETTVVEEGE